MVYDRTINIVLALLLLLWLPEITAYAPHIKNLNNLISLSLVKLQIIGPQYEGIKYMAGKPMTMLERSEGAS